MPTVDSYGTVWLGEVPTGPAVFKSSVKAGQWFASLGNEGTVLTDGAGLKYFSTAEQAFRALQSARGVRV